MICTWRYTALDGVSGDVACVADAMDGDPFCAAHAGDRGIEARVRARIEADTEMLGAVIEARRCGTLRREIADLAVDSMRVVHLRETARAFVTTPGTDPHEVLRRLPPWERWYAEGAWLRHLEMAGGDVSPVYLDLAALIGVSP